MRVLSQSQSAFKIDATAFVPATEVGFGQGFCGIIHVEPILLVVKPFGHNRQAAAIAGDGSADIYGLPRSVFL